MGLDPDDDPDDLPACFGDEDEYDPVRDHLCRRCHVRTQCGEIVRDSRYGRRGPTDAVDARLRRLRGAKRRGTDRRPSTSSREPAVEEPKRVSRQEVPFSYALLANSLMASAQALVGEVFRSMAHLPRFEYRSPWDDYDDDDDDDEDYDD